MTTEPTTAHQPRRYHTAASLPRWVTATIIGAVLLFLAGALIAQFDPRLLVGSTAVINDAAARYAQYTATRDFALAALLLTALTLDHRPTLAVSMMLAAAIQLLDAAGDLLHQRWMLAPGLLLLAAVLGLAGRRLAADPETRHRNHLEPL